MTNITYISDIAELTEANYANLIKTNNPERALIASGFSATQAEKIVADWAVIDHLPDDPESDFSATLFKSNASGELTLAFRGTAGLVNDLLYADLGDVVLGGLSVDQVADIYQSPCCLDLRTEINSLGAAA
ncbi:hypothetical protein [Pseudomonas indica]|uniref:hypothetical protein n=1 Tax=Pseudomonas indica TaxID=137658 RepID=UPI003FD57368